MPTPLTDADKVLRNDTGKDIVEKLDDIAQALGVGVNADQINYDNTESGLEAENVQDAIDEVNSIQNESIEKIYNYIRFPYISNIDKVPYLFRKSGGSLSVGDWEEDKLVGGSVSFNQLIQNGNFPTGTESSWLATGSTIAFSDNKCTVTASSSIAAASNIRQSVLAGKENHVIFASQTITSSKYVGGSFYIGENYTTAIPVQANTRTVVEAIQKTKSSYSNTQLYFYFNRSSTLERYDTLTIENAFAIDLTQMFGEEVAEYFNALETEEQGKGVKAFRSLFPNVYYAYNTGEIISVKTSAHKITGKNICPILSSQTVNGVQMTASADGTLTFNRVASSSVVSNFEIPVLMPSGEYTISANNNMSFSGDTLGNMFFRPYDINGTSISVVPFNAVNKTYTFTNNLSKIVIRIASQFAESNFTLKMQLEHGNTATTYEPYEEHIYPLDSNLELRGSIKLNTTTNTLYNDGDTYDSDGNVIRKYGYLELDGSNDESYNWVPFGSTVYINMLVSDLKGGTLDGVCNWLQVHTNNTQLGVRLGANSTSKYIVFDRITENISDVTDLASWRTYLSNHPLQIDYPLDTSTSETATPFTNPQRVFNNGTEEYIDERTIAMPVGHETKYQYTI